MSTKKEKQKTSSHKIFYENPYDLQTIFESLKIAQNNNRDLIYLDLLITNLRINPKLDITNLNYNILRDLGLLKLEKLS